jgi:pimeloyl-ACP methyl ester carboxylesterase
MLPSIRIPQFHDMPEKSLTIKGVEWRYVTSGRGEKSILLFDSASGGADALRLLAAALEDEYRTITPTLAGVKTLKEVCDAASAILDREHVGRAVVCGGAFGAALAQAFFERRRAQTEDLVLLAPRMPDRKTGERAALAAKVLRLVPFALVRGLMKTAISQHRRADIPAEQAGRVAEFRRRYDEHIERGLTKQTMLTLTSLLADFNLHESYAPAAHAEWPGRVLIIESSDDPAIPAGERRRVRDAYPRALVCTFPDAGHMIPLLRLEELVGVVKAFLKDDYSTPAEIFSECSVAEGHDHLMLDER